MLEKLPSIGDYVTALTNFYPCDCLFGCKNYDETDCGTPYQTTGTVYRIVGISEKTGNPYFIDDSGDRIYIDDETLDLYRLSGGNATPRNKIWKNESGE